MQFFQFRKLFSINVHLSIFLDIHLKESVIFLLYPFIGYKSSFEFVELFIMPKKGLFGGVRFSKQEKETIEKKYGRKAKNHDDLQRMAAELATRK